MKAAVVERYGPPENVTVQEVSVPKLRKGEALVRVEATAITAGDARMRSGKFPRGFAFPARLAIGIRGPRAKVLGGTFSGVVEQVAEGVTEFAPGDAVAGMAGMKMGAHAEYMKVKVGSLTAKPDDVSFEDAAGALFGGSTALCFLRDRAKLQPGESVLVNGASGSLGSAAVQLAVQLGATVTAVSSGRNEEQVRRLGATQFVDYEQMPVADIDDQFDVVFDAVGNISRAQGLSLLTPGGRLILAVASLGDTIRARGQVIAGPATEKAEDFSYLLDLVSKGEFDPLVRNAGSLTDIHDAYRLVDSGHKVGNLVISPNS